MSRSKLSYFLLFSTLVGIASATYVPIQYPSKKLLSGSGISIVNTSTTTTISSSLIPGSTNYIQNTNSLQSGATFYVSSGTVAGQLNTMTILLNGNAVNMANGLDQLTGSGLISNSLVDGSSITKQGLLTAGANITLTPGAGSLTIASAGGGGAGSTIYNSTSTAGFPFGFSASTATFTGLTASLPVQTDSGKNLTSAAINLSGSQVTGSLPAASVASGSLGSSVIASSITLSAMWGSPTLNGANITNLQGAQVGSGVPAANIAGGSLGPTVRASSVTWSSIDQSTVTVQGNTFNGANQLDQLSSSGLIVNSVVDGSSVTKSGVLKAGSNITLTPAAGQTTIATSFSGTPIFHVGASDFAGALTSGTTFFVFVPTNAITLTKITSIIVVAGVGGVNGDSYSVGISGAVPITASSAAAAPAGTVTTATGSIAVGAGTQVSVWLVSDEATQPSTGLDVEYKMQ